MKILERIKIGLVAFIMALGLSVKAQIKGEKYTYDHDTIIISPDSNIYEVKNLGERVNSSHVESGPRISPDGKELYFFRINHPKNIAKTRDIWMSQYNEEDSTWSDAKHMSDRLNCHGPNGVHWISPDGKTMLLHNTYLKNGTMGNGVSITSKEKDGKWSKPKALKIKGYDNHEVCSFILTDDMETLIMCIQQKGSYGKQDLFYSKKKGKNKYTKPRNMGPILNTPGVEATAWINHGADTLYFSSNGHPNSVGGMDIYMSVRTDTTVWDKWSKPTNLGVPYNTTDDEYYFSIPDNGDFIYMAHHFENLSDSAAHSDIVKIRLKEPKIDPFLFVTGKIYDDFTKEPIPGTVTFKIQKTKQAVLESFYSGGDEGYDAKVPGKQKYTYTAVGKVPDTYLPRDGTLDLTELKNEVQDRTIDIYLRRNPGILLSGMLFDEKTKEKLDGKIEISIAGSDEVYKTINVSSQEGYEVFLEPGKDYDVKFSANPYLPKVVNFNLTKLDDYKEEEKEIYLQLLDGASFALKNIFFDHNKSTLKSESYKELNRLVKVMKDFPLILVEIAGHTDNVGSENYNLNLSQGRAQSVVNYLVKQGIERRQFKAQGYGESTPVASNETASGKAQNRRVEFKVLKVK